MANPKTILDQASENGHSMTVSEKSEQTEVYRCSHPHCSALFAHDTFGDIALNMIGIDKACPAT